MLREVVVEANGRQGAGLVAKRQRRAYRDGMARPLRRLSSDFRQLCRLRRGPYPGAFAKQGLKADTTEARSKTHLCGKYTACCLAIRATTNLPRDQLPPDRHQLHSDQVLMFATSRSEARCDFQPVIG